MLDSLLNDLRKVKSSKELKEIKIKLLGKSSLIMQKMRNLGKLPEMERVERAQEIQKLKQSVEDAIKNKAILLKEKELQERLESERLDLTIPSKPEMIGGIHPVTQCLDELIQIFSEYGFEIKDASEIEDDWHNFTALNIPKDHPARQMHDTFYFNSERLLRTHTSPVQIRAMKGSNPPHCFIAPGKVYRSDYDSTHSPMFHQIEGVVVDRNVHMGHLKSLILNLIESFFEESKMEVRFRPSFFPFTEPSAEVDIKDKRWLEVMGCGMIHPTVLKNVGIDSDEYQGFAFGLGIERFAMLKYGIDDLRLFFDSDIRWLKHYSFSALDIPTLARGLTR